jgi:hypothetical protein
MVSPISQAIAATSEASSSMATRTRQQRSPSTAEGPAKRAYHIKNAAGSAFWLPGTVSGA